MSQLVSGVEWWVPIPWLLAGIGIAIALLNFRRSRHPGIRIHRMRTDCLGKYPDWAYHEYFTVEILCVGADIFDLSVLLESKRPIWHRTRSWIGWSRMMIVERQEFKPKGDLPNPVKNGQVVVFELSDHFMCNWRATGHGGHLYRCPSQLWPWCVRIVAYHSGRRLLLKRSSWRFPRVLRQFDSIARKVKNERAAGTADA